MKELLLKLYLPAVLIALAACALGEVALMCGFGHSEAYGVSIGFGWTGAVAHLVFYAVFVDEFSF